MNLFPSTGDISIDLSSITFDPNYRIPPSGTIESSYQKGFELPREIAKAWKTHNHEIASEFISSYYRSKGYEAAIEIHRVRDHDDCIGGVLVSVRGKDGFDGITYGVWESHGKIIVEEDRRPLKVWG
jgi:hypothetical protein